MKKYDHLKLPLLEMDHIERKKRGGFKMPDGGDKNQFSQQAQKNCTQLSRTCDDLKTKFPTIDPKLIFEINIDQNLAVDAF